MTKVKPSAPNQKTYVGEVINASSGGSGSMSIRIVQSSVLGGTDSNVQFSALANNDLVQYDSSLQYWKNVAASAATVGTATNAVNTAITNDTSTAAIVYPTWVTANTGNLPQKVSSTKLTFNPSTGVLTVTGGIGGGVF
jgi:predicted dinucleotide-utilizing enzyme